MSYAEKILAMQVEVEDVGELHRRIESATKLKQLNEIRMACVALMKQDNSLLKKWQDKYWSLKNCPTCGRTQK